MSLDISNRVWFYFGHLMSYMYNISLAFHTWCRISSFLASIVVNSRTFDYCMYYIFVFKRIAIPF